MDKSGEIVSELLIEVISVLINPHMLIVILLAFNISWGVHIHPMILESVILIHTEGFLLFFLLIRHKGVEFLGYFVKDVLGEGHLIFL